MVDKEKEGISVISSSSSEETTCAKVWGPRGKIGFWAGKPSLCVATQSGSNGEVLVFCWDCTPVTSKADNWRQEARNKAIVAVQARRLPELNLGRARSLPGLGVREGKMGTYLPRDSRQFSFCPPVTGDTPVSACFGFCNLSKPTSQVPDRSGQHL